MPTIAVGFRRTMGALVSARARSSFGVFGAATVHGLAAGTDRWALPLYAASIAAVIGLTAWRVLTKRGTNAPVQDRSRSVAV